MSAVYLVSDSHLSARTPEADANWELVLEAIDRSDAELVVHTGDISLDGANQHADLEHARAQLDRLSRPWLAIPGNHDIGDIAGSSGPINDERRRRYREVFGDRFWVTEVAGWRLVGIDIQELSCDTAEAAHWWRWLEEQLTGEGPVAVFQHRPLQPLVDGEADVGLRYVGEPDRSRLRTLYIDASVQLVVSGHVHQWRSIDADELRHIWVPSTWATMPDRSQPLIGEKTVGMARLNLDEHVNRPTVVVPDDMAQSIVGETIPMPYDH